VNFTKQQLITISEISKQKFNNYFAGMNSDRLVPGANAACKRAVCKTGFIG
jgi:hypothetical protein